MSTPDSFRVIFVGDIVGRPGRKILRRFAEDLRKRYNATFIIANAENAADGCGITKKVSDEIFSADIDLLTMGNHTWDKQEAELFIGDHPKIIRPANFPAETPGRGFCVLNREGIELAVINLMGRVYLPPNDSPFTAADRSLDAIATKNIIVDIHAEATSEKKAIAIHLDGRVSAVLGTHTHVQTADECILSGGTAFITDVGMTGGHDSIIGNKKQGVMDRFLKGINRKLEVAGGDPRVSFVVIEIDTATGTARSISRHQEKSDGGNDEIC